MEIVEILIKCGFFIITKNCLLQIIGKDIICSIEQKWFMGIITKRKLKSWEFYLHG